MAANDSVKGFIIGGGIGTVLGMLYAPKSGKEVRKEIRNASEELLKKSKEQYEQASKKIEELVDRKKELFCRTPTKAETAG